MSSHFFYFPIFAYLDGRGADRYRLVWAKKVSLAALCLDISSASFGILFKTGKSKRSHLSIWREQKTDKILV
jgi:hypothetical protein